MAERRQAECLTIVAIFTVLAFLFVSGRTYSRYLGRNFDWDDFLIIFAMILLLGQTIAVWEFVLFSGTGFHVYELPKKSIHEQVVTNRWSFAVQMFYHPMMFSIRASMIVFLWRMKDRRRRITYSLYAVSRLWPIFYKLALGGQCIQSRTFVLSSCALSMFMDLIIIPIPSIMVWNLQMERKTKMLVVMVIWIATGVSVGRFIVYYYRIAPTNMDRTWDIGVSISIAEPAVHIMTACAPATNRLFHYLSPYFARSHPTTHYQDAIETIQSTTDPRPPNNHRFSLGLRRSDDHKHLEDALDHAHGSSQKHAAAHTFGMKTLTAVDSRDELVEDKSSSIHVVETEPQHCLAHAK
ncbi:hypothetical protein ACEQ8H_002928 [Pleosporales sp. CAS-2024a]